LLLPLSLIRNGLFLLYYNQYYCEASTTTATVNPGWNKQRQEFQRKLKSIRYNRRSDTLNKESKNIFDDEVTEDKIGLAGYRSEYADRDGAQQEQIKKGYGQSFSFLRFQSPAAIRKALDSVRSSSSFKWFEGVDRKGYFSSTKLGGDWVLAESKQVAVDCTTEEVLRVYLSGELQAKWNEKNILECCFTKLQKNNNDGSDNSTRNVNNNNSNIGLSHKVDLWTRSKGNSNDDKNQSQHRLDGAGAIGDSYYYRQDLLLKSQRVIRSHTGIMKYQQIIEIDKVGRNNYSILVRLLKNKNENNRKNDQVEGTDNSAITTTAKKPFESLQVYVNLEQDGKDVNIYAAGVFEVNRQVVPNLIVFDTSGIAGSIAGKGTLWLAAYFEKWREKSRNQ
jgi:hypothetical protein